MSKTTMGIAAILAALFPKSDKAISEKLSTEEFNQFSEDATEIDNRLNAQTTGNEKVVEDLKTANATIQDLTKKLNDATQLAESRGTELTAITAERDRYKAHYDKQADKGKKNPNEDENSRGSLAGYNQHALEVFQKTNAAE